MYLWENGKNPYPTKVPNASLSYTDANGNQIDYIYDEGNRQIHGQGSDQNMYGGFLSFVFFSSNVGGGRNPDGTFKDEAVRGPERLKIHDLVPQWGEPDHRHKALGFREGKYEGKYFYSGPFESIIGIY